MDVGVRELRDHLSRYLERVRAGDELVVTDRGRAIARMVPVDSERPLDRMIADGFVTPARRMRTSVRPAVEARGTVSDLVRDQRR
ncbi:MAG: type II toxin-antitoxin system prevent-host-death family antitoxin [Acidimicrobiia bacterium]|nr:type II toxin-antitoxin system prevent-host-death family antitoxin [Acidimicrobiia bacterium]